MKKIFIMVIIFGGAIVTLLSCSKENDINMNTDAKNVTTKSLPYTMAELFTYTTNRECEANSVIAFAELAGYINDELSVRTDITDIVVSTTVSGGVGRINGIYYLNVPNNTIIEEGIADPFTGEIVGSYPRTPIFDFIGAPINPIISVNGNCPDGFTFLKDCVVGSSASDYAQCVGNAVGTFNANNFNSGGQNEFLMNTNQFSGVTTICAKATRL